MGCGVTGTGKRSPEEFASSDDENRKGGPDDSDDTGPEAIGGGRIVQLIAFPEPPHFAWDLLLDSPWSARGV